MILRNKIFVSIVAILFTFNFSYADNKTDLLSEITTLETNLVSLKSNSINDLDSKISVLMSNYDNVFINLTYDSKTVDYLVSLWKINSNFKQDLLLELSTLKNEILSKINIEISSLNTVKDDVNYKYTTISDNEKTNIESRINNINNNYKNLGDTFVWKINLLNSKYTTNLENYTNNLKSVVESNKITIDLIKDFASKYEILYTLNAEFEKNHNSFKETYLSYAWDLTLFSENKQKEYVETLKTELERLRDANIDANKSLENYKPDIDRFINILLENFENSLFLKIADSYWIIYSDSNINSIISRFNTLKNRYYDLDWNLKAKEVISNTGALKEVSFLQEKLWEINTKIKILLWDENTSNTIDNVKIRLENEMIRFYNSNYQNYREDLLLKLKEKLNITALETKNSILAADTIDLRYSLLNDKISVSNDIKYINTQIDNFKKDVAKYSYLNSDILNTKITNLDNNLSIFVIQKELTQLKYNKMSSTKYETQLSGIFNQLKTKFPSNYKNKLNIVLGRVNKALEYKLTDKNKHMLLIIKLEILKFIK